MTDVSNQRQHPDWTFLSNHTHVLHCIFLWPDIRIRDIAEKVLITERAVQRIVLDLEWGGYVKRERVGRQNHYRLKPGLHLRHPLEHHVEVGRLLAVLQPKAAVTARGLDAAPSRADAKGISRLKKRRSKPRKLVAKKSI
jgi:hypothetical protein